MVLDGKGWAEQDKQVDENAKMERSVKFKNWYEENRKQVIKRVQSNYKAVRSEIISILGHNCAFCGYNQDPSNLNFHHRVPMEIKGNKIYHYYDNIDILLLLCVKCHVEWHRVMDELLIDDIFKEG